MNLLILQGPNLNLIGVKSAKHGKCITLDKINKGIRSFIRDKDITVKIYQTHSVGKAVTLLQRNRNWANGIIIAPGVWSSYEAVIADTLKLIEIPTVEVYDELDNSDIPKNSLLSSVCAQQITAPADKMFILALEYFNKLKI